MKKFITFEDKTVAVGNKLATSDAKFGPDKIAYLFLGNCSSTISLISLLVLFSTPLQQITNFELIFFGNFFRSFLRFCEGFAKKN